MADSFRAGEFPRGDPFTYRGRPFYENMCAPAFYPPTLAAILASVLVVRNAAIGRAAVERIRNPNEV